MIIIIKIQRGAISTWCSEISVKCDGVGGDFRVLNIVCDQCSIVFTFSLSYLLTKGSKPGLIEAVVENKNNDKIPQLQIKSIAIVVFVSVFISVEPCSTLFLGSGNDG